MILGGWGSFVGFKKTFIDIRKSSGTLALYRPILHEIFCTSKSKTEQNNCITLKHFFQPTYGIPTRCTKILASFWPKEQIKPSRVISKSDLDELIDTLKTNHTYCQFQSTQRAWYYSSSFKNLNHYYWLIQFNSTTLLERSYWLVHFDSPDLPRHYHWVVNLE